MYQVVPATAEHAKELAAFMRAADRREVWAAAHHTPAEAVALSVKATHEPLAGIANGRVVCIFGVAQATALGSYGRPWMLGTDELPAHARQFLRLSRLWVGQVVQDYDRLENYVDRRNRLAIRWLRWLGFSLDEAEPYGPDREWFHRFHADAVHHIRAAAVAD